MLGPEYFKRQLSNLLLRFDRRRRRASTKLPVEEGTTTPTTRRMTTTTTTTTTSLSSKTERRRSSPLYFLQRTATRKRRIYCELSQGEVEKEGFDPRGVHATRTIRQGRCADRIVAGSPRPRLQCDRRPRNQAFDCMGLPRRGAVYLIEGPHGEIPLTRFPPM